MLPRYEHTPLLIQDWRLLFDAVFLFWKHYCHGELSNDELPLLHPRIFLECNCWDISKKTEKLQNPFQPDNRKTDSKSLIRRKFANAGRERELHKS